MSNVECQRFFAFSKRVPKDVKRFCGICRQHGKLEETRGHICEFKDCECQKCNLVRSRRLVMSQQIRLRRAQDKRFQRTTEPEEADVVPILSNSAIGATNATSPDQQQPNQQAIAEAMADQQQLMDAKNMCYFCQKCKNHGILVWKKQHKRQCPFTNCTCDFCELIETRRRLDQHIKRRKSEPQNGGGENGQGDDNKSESDESIPRKKSTASLPAQIEAMCSNSSGVSNAFWRASPPGGAGLSIPIGIAQNRIAEQQEEQNQSQQSQENPLDALAAQISRIQQNSPEQNSRQSPASSINFGIPMSAGSTPPPTLAPMVPPSQPPSLDQQQILLMNQLLLASASGAIPSGHSADFASGNTVLPSSMFGGMEQQMLAAASNSGPQNEAILGQMLLQYMASQQQQQQMMATEEMKQHQQIGQMGEEQHRELLLQIIAQLLQDQHLSDHQAAIQQQQQQKSLMEAAMMMANLSGANTMNAGLAELQQIVALQSATGLIDPTLLATSFLLSQQQQQFNKDSALLMPMPTVDANNGNKREEQSPPQHSQQHQSAFTPIRPGGNFGGFQ